MVLKYNGITIANQVVFARNIFSQMLGLMLYKSIPQDFAMIFTLRKSTTLGVHMLFMRFPIDALFLNEDKRLVNIATLKPWVGHKHVKGVKYLIEMNSGIVEEYGLKVGDQLSFDD